jgi:hypothetical protein
MKVRLKRFLTGRSQKSDENITNAVFLSRFVKSVIILIFLLVGSHIIRPLYLFSVDIVSLFLTSDSPSHEVCRFSDARGDLIVISSRRGVWLDDVENSYRAQHRYKELLPGVLLPLGSLREVSTKHGVDPSYRCPGE